MSLSALLVCQSLALSPKQRNFLSILLRGRLAQHTTFRDHIEFHTPGGLEFGVLSLYYLSHLSRRRHGSLHLALMMRLDWARLRLRDHAPHVGRSTCTLW